MSLTPHALVIGVSQYQHIRPLPRVTDAEDVAGILRDPSACGYDPANVTLLQEADATRAAILEGLDRLAERAGPGSTALVYFSGHGGQPPGGDSYLMPIEGEWSSPERLDATAIASRVLRDKLAAICAERLTVLLDCCHAADLAEAKDVQAPAWTPELADDVLATLARGRVVMAAARGGGSAYVYSGARHGLFTEHLIAGLHGAAGGDDGFVRVLDLYHHIQRNVVARNRAQEPVLKAEIRDNYEIARCQRARTVLAAPPASTSFAYDVLLVFSPDERDSAWARGFLRLLEDRAIRVCTEELDAELGAMRVSEIVRLVSSSRYTLPVLTPRFSAGGFQELQTQMALHLGIEEGRVRLIPILRQPCEAGLALRTLVPLDLSRDENLARGIERLERTLRRAQGRS